MPRWDVTASQVEADTFWDAKGDLAVGSGADASVKLAVGCTGGHVLQICSSEASGLIWAASPSPTGAFDNGTNNVTSGGTWSVDVDATGTDGACLSAAGTLRLGACEDLRIYHGGTNSYITGVTGDLIVGTQGSGAGIILDAEDDTIEFKQSGTIKGIFDSNGLTIKDQLDLRLEESGSGCSYIAMQAAACMGANYTITWPAAVAGTCGFALKSTTGGVLSWGTAGGASVPNPFFFS